MRTGNPMFELDHWRRLELVVREAVGSVLTAPAPETVESIQPELCHLIDMFDKQLCNGRLVRDAPDCGLYQGEGICSECGLPICASCALIASLDS